MKSRRILYAATMVIVFFCAVALWQKGNVGAATNPVVILDETELAFEVPPRIVNDRTMLPFRAIAEAMGAEVEWIPESRTVIMRLHGKYASMIINDSIMYYGEISFADGKDTTHYRKGSEYAMDSPPIIIDDRTLVPLRAVSEALGATVDWIAESSTLVLTSPPKPTVSTAPTQTPKSTEPSWTFGKGENSLEDWETDDAVGIRGVENGLLIFDIDLCRYDNSVEIYSTNNLSFNASEYKYLYLKLKNTTEVTASLDVSFVNAADGKSGGWNSVLAEYYVREHGNMQEIIVDLSSNTKWKGTIKRLKLNIASDLAFDFNVTGTFEIERIALINSGNPTKPSDGSTLGVSVSNEKASPASKLGGYTPSNFFGLIENKFMSYRVHKPAEKEKNKKYPVLIHFHGSGEADNVMDYPEYCSTLTGSVLIEKLIEKINNNPQSYESYVVMPLAYDGGPDPAYVKWIIDKLINEESADPNRIYITGVSMGGFASCDFMYSHPNVPACVVPICGARSDSREASFSASKNIPIRIYHSDDDDVVSVEESRELYKNLTKAGHKNVEYFETTGYGHGVWEYAQGETDMLEWMYKQIKR